MSEMIYGIKTPIRLDYTYMPGRAQSRFLRALSQRRILGQRCPQCHKVYVPSRGSCPICAVATDQEVELAHSGTVTMFCIINLPLPGQTEPPPYASASVLLDGADVPFYHLIRETPARDVRTGLRVEAVWAPDEELQPSLESIRHFRPTGEPDAPLGSGKERP